MGKYCRKKGIPDDDIMQKKKSLNTYDNVLYTVELLIKGNKCFDRKEVPYVD
ncbi:MAG: ElyC/SanA/YdcF family protein [Treponema sp.]